MTLTAIVPQAPTLSTTLPATGSPAWGAHLRQSVKSLAREIETGYLRLAHLLNLVYETHEDNDPSLAPLYVSWGFATWEEWVEVELGLNAHKARSLRLISRRVEPMLEAASKSAGAPAATDLKSQLGALGWTKAREVLKVATPESLPQWLALAKTSKYHDLEITVKAHLGKVVAAQAEAAKAPLPPPQTLHYDSQTNEPVPASKVTPLLPSNPLALVPAPTATVVGGLTRKVFALYADQKTLVEDALKRASQASGSDKEGYNLSLIALSFLSSTPFTLPQKAAAELLGSVAEKLGFSIIAINAEGDLVIDTINHEGTAPTSEG